MGRTKDRISPVDTTRQMLIQLIKNARPEKTFTELEALSTEELEALCPPVNPSQLVNDLRKPPLRADLTQDGKLITHRRRTSKYIS